MSGDAVSPRGYPRPLLRRAQWVSLDGAWDFAGDPDRQWLLPGEVIWGERIRVPFSPETAASGVDRTEYLPRCWYRTTITPPTSQGPLHIHFGAVDYHATVWLDGELRGRHEGGYTPFTIDATPAARASAGQPIEIVVRVDDDPHDLSKPRGKQDWQPDPHSIWYHRTTGIWQSVWLEPLPPTWIAALRWRASLLNWEIRLHAGIAGELTRPLSLRVRLSHAGRLLSGDTYSVVTEELSRGITLTDPGIDDFRNELLWSPGSPSIIDAELELLDEAGRVVDHVFSYTALREVGVSGDRFMLNGRAYPLRLVLDQGYWPASGMTAPSDEALRRDVELALAMGFNGVRKHQKVEDPRYLYWADHLGLLVWAEMPSAYRFTADSVRRLTVQWMEVLARDGSHPCIVSWVPFNESWGVPNLPNEASHRHYVRALYHLTRTLDPSRPVVGNDGWESVATDIIGIHDYDANPQALRERYRSDEVLPRLFRRERPGGRVLVLEGHSQPDQPIVLSEFGGIACSRGDNWSWGYSRCHTEAELQERFAQLMDVVTRLNVFAGFCYTQFADTYQEANGLLYDDRTPKMPLAEIAAAVRGR
ncbi:MAG TPA: glycoside hydrolase family 2 TIM barrel-domain containing protein [Steroidobacteraceae bacterium]|nr:glycoside hydrolase family 2 TIM barrel-domain containing protein [Steroidobacteraceae bacterium]